MIAYWVEIRGRGESFHFKNAPFIRGAVVLVMILILWIGGYLSLSPAPSGKPFSVAIAQGNILPELKWKRDYRDQILSKYENLSVEVLKNNPQLIVWPEASTPGFVLKDKDLYQRMITIVRQLKTHVLVGSAEYPKFSKTLM